MDYLVPILLSCLAILLFGLPSLTAVLLALITCVLFL